MNPKILAFIQSCVRERKIFWTYHVTMRLSGRYIPREAIFNSTDTYQIIEEYAEDKYLPSYLVLAKHKNSPIHILFAPNFEDDCVSIITVYKPDADKWEKDLKIRRTV